MPIEVRHRWPVNTEGTPHPEPRPSPSAAAMVNAHQPYQILPRRVAIGVLSYRTVTVLTANPNKGPGGLSIWNRLQHVRVVKAAATRSCQNCPSLTQPRGSRVEKNQVFHRVVSFSPAATQRHLLIDHSQTKPTSSRSVNRRGGSATAPSSKLAPQVIARAAVR